MSKLNVVSIGGFDHSVFVFDDMLGTAEIELLAFATKKNSTISAGNLPHRDYKYLIFVIT